LGVLKNTSKEFIQKGTSNTLQSEFSNLFLTYRDKEANKLEFVDYHVGKQLFITILKIDFSCRMTQKSWVAGRNILRKEATENQII
jgi:hypothetical protein